MAAFKRLPRLLRGRSDVRSDVDEEIAAHLEAKTRALVASGLDEEAARAEAHRRFGDVTTTRDVMTSSALRKHRRTGRRDSLDALFFDLRYSLRQLRRSPGFTASVIVTLGLGLGANAAMFGVLDRLLLRPPAHVRDAADVRRVYLTVPEEGREQLVTEVSYRRLTELQGGVKDAMELAGVSVNPFVAGEAEEAREIRGAVASANLFPMLGVRPHLGRFLDPGEGGAQEVVLGFEWWRSAHGSDSTILGRVIPIASGRFTVVGVAPERFSGIEVAPVDAWLSALAAPTVWTHLPPQWRQQHNFSWMSLVGRLRDGVNEAQAVDKVALAYRASLELQGGEPAKVASQATAQLHPVLLQRGPERNDDTRVAIWLGAVAFVVLLLACTNVANLLLARAAERQGEVAVRLAMGVSRIRLVRQLLLETALLATAGAAAGLVLARFTERALHASLLTSVDSAAGGVDLRVVGFALLLAVLACLISGLGPAWFSMRTDVRSMLTAAGRGIHRSSRFQSGLLVAQIALSTVLLIGAGLFVRSLVAAQATRLGYDADRLILVSLRNRSPEPVPGGMSVVYRQMAARARALPGVVGATTTMQVPFSISGSTYLDVPGIDSVERLGRFNLNGVGEDYFRTTGTRILRGRALTNEDRRGTPLVMVVSDSMARTLWPGRDPIGQCVKVGGPTFPCSDVVGVAENVHQYEIRQESSLQYWFPESQEQGQNSGAFGVLVRVNGDPVQLAPGLRSALVANLPGTIHLTLRPLGTSVARAMRPWRLGATMFTAFGILGLIIAMVGLFSALAYAVTQRRREFGVRMALGARGGGIVRMVLGQGLRLAAAGLALGIVMALLAGGRMEPLLLGVSPRDPAVALGVVIALGVTAILAGLLPAWRAARVDPSDALRSD